MSFATLIAPSTSRLQQDYIDKRQRALRVNDPDKNDAVEATILGLQKEFGVGEPWLQTLRRITTSMREADLTINLDASKWFNDENHFSGYAQMYERAATPGGMDLKDTALNPAPLRAMVDDLVTIPDDWRNASRFSEKRQLHKAFNMTAANHADAARLHPDVKPKANKHTLHANDSGGWGTKNKSFNPKAKQIFAALNYGRRPSGGTTGYGYTHMILRPGLKRDAIYFLGDTFHLASQGVNAQASWETLGRLMARLLPKVGRDIWRGCYQGHHLADESNADFLLEAHIFRKIKFAEDVQQLVLSRRKMVCTGTGAATVRTLVDMDAQEWARVHHNAGLWCQKHNVRLVSPPP